MGDDLHLEHFRNRLIDTRQQLQTTAHEREIAGQTVELDQQRVGRLSRMDALQMQAMARAEAQRAKLQLKLIAEALKRLESGEYGQCVECGQPVAIGRLEADPAASLCIQCAELAD